MRPVLCVQPACCDTISTSRGDRPKIYVTFFLLQPAELCDPPSACRTCGWTVHSRGAGAVLRVTHDGGGTSAAPGMEGAEQLPAPPSSVPHLHRQESSELGNHFFKSEGRLGSGIGPCLRTPTCSSVGRVGPPLSLSSSLPTPILLLRTVPHLFGLPSCSCPCCASHDGSQTRTEPRDSARRRRACRCL